MINWFKKAPLAQQLIGLEPLWENLRGKTLLDVGCAEGLISLECMKHGAKVEGLEIRSSAVKEAQAIGVNCLEADVQHYQLERHYDIVLMLGILHKLADPITAFKRYLKYCNDLAVVRLPWNCWLDLVDSRSGGVPHNMHIAAMESGFYLDDQTEGPHNQLVLWLKSVQ